MVRVLERVPDPYTEEDSEDRKSKSTYQRVRQQVLAIYNIATKCIQQIGWWVLSTAVYTPAAAQGRSLKAVPGAREARRCLVMSLIALAIFGLWALFGRSAPPPVQDRIVMLQDASAPPHAPDEAMGAQWTRTGGAQASQPLPPVLGTYTTISGAECLWAAPPAEIRPRGILFFAHGCRHSPYNFWHPSETCPQCNALPEEIAIARTVLDAGFALVTVSSEGTCWDLGQPGAVSQDTSAVVQAIGSLRADQGWGGLPLIAAGASSGGAFALHLAAHLQLAGVVAQIMALPPARLQGFTPPGGDELPAPYPPTVFMHMPRDQRTALSVQEAMDNLAARGVAVRELQTLPRRLTPETLSERVESITPGVSAQLFNALLDGGALASGEAEEPGALLEDPRQSLWRDALRSRIPNLEDVLPEGLRPDASSVSEELNLLYANHEIISDSFDVALSWIMSQQT